MISFGHRTAISSDVPFLARLNQQVIEGEGPSNPLNLAKLETRMRSLGTGRRTSSGSRVYGLPDHARNGTSALNLTGITLNRRHCTESFGQLPNAR